MEGRPEGYEYLPPIIMQVVKSLRTASESDFRNIRTRTALDSLEVSVMGSFSVMPLGSCIRKGIGASSPPIAQ